MRKNIYKYHQYETKKTIEIKTKELDKYLYNFMYNKLAKKALFF